MILIAQNIFAQAPIITSFAPTSGPVGTNVTINGNNFSTTASDNIVYLGSVKAIVNTATQTSLIVTVPAGTNYLPIAVTTNNLTAYSSQPFVVTFPGSGPFLPESFAQKIDSGTDVNPITVAIGDLDNDGKGELIVGNNSSGEVSVLKNNCTNGIISFAQKIDFPTPTFIQNIAIGDLDGDGKLDVIPAGSPDTISILRNTSTAQVISFASILEISTGTSPTSVAVGDLDGDGKPDLAAHTDQ